MPAPMTATSISSDNGSRCAKGVNGSSRYFGEQVVAGEVPDGGPPRDQPLVALFAVLGVDNVGVEVDGTV